VRLPESLEWTLHRLCAKGNGDFQVRRLRGDDADDAPAEHGADDRTALTLSLNRTAMQLRAGWNAPKRTHATAEYALGVGVSIEHWARDVVLLHLPEAAAAMLRDADADYPNEPLTPNSAQRARAGATFQPDVGVGVGGEATGGSVVRLEVAGGREARDLLVLALRYFVATSCGAHGR
jgi:hypothetical protein